MTGHEACGWLEVFLATLLLVLPVVGYAKHIWDKGKEQK